jgi:RNA polymerase sigma factor for flagellar operon FliA
MIKKNREDINNLWIKFSKNKNCLETRNTIIKYYFEFVDRIAKKTAEKLLWKVRSDELRSSGFLGLYNAIDSYDLSRNIKFETFAYRRIKGAMIDAIRSEDWVPRTVRQRQDLISREKTRLENDNGEKATIYDIIKSLGISENDYNKRINKYRVVSSSSIEDNFSEFKTEENCNKKDLNVCLISKVPPAEYILSQKETISNLISKLDKDSKRVIYMHYCKNYNLKEIAQKLGIKENKVGKIHKKFIKLSEEKLLVS